MEPSSSDHTIDQDIDVIEANDAVQIFGSHTDSVFCLAAAGSPNSGLIVSGGCDDIAFLWDVYSGVPLAKLTGFSDSVVDVAFSFDSSYVAAASYDSTVRIWKVDDLVSAASSNSAIPEPTIISDFSEPVEKIQWHPKGNFLLSVSSDALFMHSVPNGRLVRTFTGSYLPSEGCWINEGKHVAAGFQNGDVSIFSPRDSSIVASCSSGKPENRNSSGILTPITCISASSSTKLLSVGSEDGTISVFTLPQLKRVLCCSQHSDSIEGLAFLSNDQWLLSSSTDGKLILLEIASKQIRFELNFEESITGMSIREYQGTNDAAYCTLSDGRIIIVDTSRGTVIDTIEGHSTTINAHCFGPDNLLIAGADDGVVLVFSLDPLPQEEEEGKDDDEEEDIDVITEEIGNV
ncbi:hypothetical protein RCL1_004483 [Eukaryota sp. TZLM3-RCL]